MRWRYALDGPLPAYLVAVAVGDYAVIPDRAGDVPLEYVVPSWASTELTHAALGETPAVMDFFGALLDTPFPWPVYRQVYVQRFLYGAMENTTLTITEGALLQPLEPWKPLMIQPGYGVFLPMGAARLLQNSAPQHFAYLWIIAQF